MRLLWLPQVLRDAGLTVHEVPGWRTRGSSIWGPLQGITCHATAGSRDATASGEIAALINGTPSAPPPVAQLYLARNGDWHVVASGRCNHNLVGWSGPNKGLGNHSLVGVEAGNDNRGEPWPAAQLRSYERGVAAIAARLDIPAGRVAGHYEHQPWPAPKGQTSTKSDPLGVDMDDFRAAVTSIMEGSMDLETRNKSYIVEGDPLEVNESNSVGHQLARAHSYGHRLILALFSGDTRYDALDGVAYPGTEDDPRPTGRDERRSASWRYALQRIWRWCFWGYERSVSIDTRTARMEAAITAQGELLARIAAEAGLGDRATLVEEIAQRAAQIVGPLAAEDVAEHLAIVARDDEDGTPGEDDDDTGDQDATEA